MRKKIVVITGSPRKNGNSFAMADAFAEAAGAAGHTIVRFDAALRRVSGCRDCEQCFEKGACAFDDDFNALAPDIDSADAVVFVTPLYFFSFTAQIKAVIDKLHAFSVARRAGKKDISNKTCGLLACCEDDAAAMDGLVKSYELMADYLKWKSVGTLLVPGVRHQGDIHKTDGIAGAAAFASKF